MQQQQPVDSSSAGQQATKTPAGVVNDQVSFGLDLEFQEFEEHLEPCYS
jgi:hypothetical protein